MPRTSVTFSSTATIDPRYVVSVGSTALRFKAAPISAITRPISQRPANQKTSAVRILSPASTAVLVRNSRIACGSMVIIPYDKLPSDLNLRERVRAQDEKHARDAREHRDVR